MPRSSKGARAKPGSNSPAKPPPKAAPQGPQFTESQQPSPPQGPDQAENRPSSADGLSPDELSLDRTEPFPDGLFRVPVPNAVFSKMPELSDSALRCLLALIHRSFRFDPAESKWVHTKDWFTRSDVEEGCGLSSQGTRNGLAELESIGWAKADRSGRSHQYQLKLEVPTERFTYVPTALLENVGDFDSGTELRVALAVLRRTWGWTCKETGPQSGNLRVVHDRWARLSNRELAEATGRSETAAREAARALQGEWLGRTRPGNGPYQYRFLPEAVGDASGGRPGAPDSFCTGTSNDLAPDRQKSGPPTYRKESRFKDKHHRTSKTSDPETETKPPLNEESAVPPTKQPQGRPEAEKGQAGAEKSDGQSPTADFTGLPDEKRDLAEKLHNVGVWAGRIAEILSRFSRGRIEANFQLYRRRAAEQTIRKPGAWLSQAIIEGYALPPSSSDAPGPAPAEGSLPPLEHKETVSEERKNAYVAQGVGEERFHRCLSRKAGPGERRFMYFDPDKGGPTRRA